MAETLTVDGTPQTEIVGSVDGIELSADEQDSLEVGQNLTDQHDQLLAGKYKDAQELEKAYIELQKKLGSDTTDTTPEPQEEVSDEEPSTEVNETAALITDASAEYDENGELSQETLNKFSSMSSEELVKAYVSMTQEQTSTAADLSDSEINSIQQSVGGKDAYNNLIEWATDNLDTRSVEAFDSIVNSGTPEAIQLAVNGLKAQYENDNGYEGRMLSGKPPRSSAGDIFRSQAQLVEAMSDPRYESDPAYRQDIINKLDRSDNLEF